MQKSFSYTEISETVKRNDPNVREFSVPTIKNFLKENDLPSRFSQSDVNEMARAAG